MGSQSESEVKSLSRVRLFAIPWTVAHQAPQSMEFSGQEYWSGLPFPSPGDLPNPGIKPGSPALQAAALLSEPPGDRKRVRHNLVMEKQQKQQNHFYYTAQGFTPPSLAKRAEHAMLSYLCGSGHTVASVSNSHLPLFQPGKIISTLKTQSKCNFSWDASLDFFHRLLLSHCAVNYLSISFFHCSVSSKDSDRNTEDIQ